MDPLSRRLTACRVGVDTHRPEGRALWRSPSAEAQGKAFLGRESAAEEVLDLQCGGWAEAGCGGKGLLQAKACECETAW